MPSERRQRAATPRGRARLGARLAAARARACGQTALLAAALLLGGCPQDIQGLGSGPLDASYTPPPCKGGPEVACQAPAAEPYFAMREKLTWTCSLPGPRASDGARPVLEGSVDSDHPEVTLAAKVDSSTGEVTLQPLGVSSQSFTGVSMTAWLKASWEGSPDDCTLVPLPFAVAGNLWAADEVNGQILVLDSGGKQVGGALAAEGVDHPRLVSVVKPGEVMVGGTTSDGKTAIAVFGNDGRKKRALASTEGITTPLRAAAGVGTFGFVSSGTLDTKGVLYVTEGDGAPQWNETLGGGLASDGSFVYLGVVNARGYKKTSTRFVPKEVNDLSYKDSSGDDCAAISGTTAVVHLAKGGFVFASRHGGAGPAPLGQLGVTDGGLRMLATLPHLHSGLPGSLSPEGPYDWLEELRPGVVVGTRDNKQGVERFEVSKVGSGELSPADWGSWSTSWIKGLARLR